MSRFTIDGAKRMIRNYTAGGSDDVVEKAAAIMVRDDACVWHAVSQVTGKPCWCSECRPDIRRIA